MIHEKKINLIDQMNCFLGKTKNIINYLESFPKKDIEQYYNIGKMYLHFGHDDDYNIFLGVDNELKNITFFKISYKYENFILEEPFEKIKYFNNDTNLIYFLEKEFQKEIE